MSLKRNFTIHGTPWTFHYIADSGRLQAYLGGYNEIGVWEPLRNHMEEKTCG